MSVKNWWHSKFAILVAQSEIEMKDVDVPDLYCFWRLIPAPQRQVFTYAYALLSLQPAIRQLLAQNTIRLKVFYTPINCTYWCTISLPRKSNEEWIVPVKKWAPLSLEIAHILDTEYSNLMSPEAHDAVLVHSRHEVTRKLTKNNCTFPKALLPIVYDYVEKINHF